MQFQATFLSVHHRKGYDFDMYLARLGLSSGFFDTARTSTTGEIIYQRKDLMLLSLSAMNRTLVVKQAIYERIYAPIFGKEGASGSPVRWQPQVRQWFRNGQSGD